MAESKMSVEEARAWIAAETAGKKLWEVDTSYTVWGRKTLLVHAEDAEEAEELAQLGPEQAFPQRPEGRHREKNLKYLGVSREMGV